MSIHQAWIIFVSYIIVGTGVYIWQQDKKKGINIIFLVLCIVAAYNVFIRFMVLTLKNEEITAFTDRFDFLWPVMIPLVIHFVIFLARDTVKAKNPAVLFFLYFPAILTVFLLIIFPGIYRTGPKIFNGYSYFGIAADGLIFLQIAALIITFLYYFLRFKDKNERKKLVYIGITISLAAIINPIEYGLLPKAGIGPYDITIAVIMTAVILIAYAIREYDIFVISPAKAAMEILSTVNEYVFLFDKELKVISLNESGLTMLGFSEQEIKKMKFYDIFEINKEFDFNNTVFKGIENGIFAAEGIIKTKENKKLPVLFSLSPVKNKKNTVSGYVCSALNTTEKKQLIENLREAVRILGEKNLEIENANIELKESYEKLKVMAKIKDNFVSVISHELRTPLTSIKGFVAFLERGVAGELNERQSEYVSIIKSNTERLLKLINELLDMSKIETGNFSIRKKTADIMMLVKSSINQMRSIAEAKRINIIEQSGMTYLNVEMDEVRIEQVMINLLNNAVKFSEPDSLIKVNVDILKGTQISLQHALQHDFIHDRDYVLISVADKGKGIESQNIEKIFDRFFQVEEPDIRKTQGAGLGLAIVREIIRAHGGEVWAESEGLGKGSTFKFVLPL